MDWVYGQAIGFLGNFFALMGNMGVELFEAGMGQRHHSLFLPPCVGAVYRQRGGLRL